MDFDEKRWDIYPMGFDANNDKRVIVCAYAYTGEVPQFLGTWSIDVNGENSKLESLENFDIPVAVIGYRLAEDSVKERSEVKFETKMAKKKAKAISKKEKAEKRFEKKLKKIEYKRKIRQMDMDTYMKIQQRKKALKELKKSAKKSQDTVTGAQ